MKKNVINPILNGNIINSVIKTGFGFKNLRHVVYKYDLNYFKF